MRTRMPPVGGRRRFQRRERGRQRCWCGRRSRAGCRSSPVRSGCGRGCRRCRPPPGRSGCGRGCRRCTPATIPAAVTSIAQRAPPHPARAAWIAAEAPERDADAGQPRPSIHAHRHVEPLRRRGLTAGNVLGPRASARSPSATAGTRPSAAPWPADWLRLLGWGLLLAGAALFLLGIVQSAVPTQIRSSLECFQWTIRTPTILMADLAKNR